MFGFVRSKWSAALVAGAVAAVVACTMGVSASEAATSSGVLAAQVPDTVVTFEGANQPRSALHLANTSFGSFGTIRDADNAAQVGTFSQQCRKGPASGLGSQTAVCTGVYKFTNGAQITLSAVWPLASNTAFDAVVTAGTLEYEGLTGSARVTPRATAGVYDVSFS
ncbi:hypothetical protein [Streptomyces sp. SPB4]|uniref:hypothetical protein n=1 Tax=Streptomyces sp. SPB4 TaxID=2940553 RepID=UPI0024737DAF|nr:hypothetical protein [Streptomyces sp. SPB4]MDH6543882.1 hypothetical protein [Streptomyces sp. SPB4]